MTVNLSSIRDNKNRGAVGQFLKNNIRPDSDLSIVSAYFKIYAYNQLKENLDSIKQLRFLFGEPTFIKAIDPSKTNKRDFKIEQPRAIGCTFLKPQKPDNKPCFAGVTGPLCAIFKKTFYTD